MTYQIKIHKRVEKFLNMQSDDFVLWFFEKAKILANNLYDETLDIKPLQWKEKWCFRLRIGKYRFKYRINEDEIVIYFYDAWGRWDVYK
jgi:mRNA-degrading endonuclease RelE of RelBE toxin-antitoxin system